MASLMKTFSGFQLFQNCLKQRIIKIPVLHFGVSVPNQRRYIPSIRTKYRPPEWLPKVQHVRYDEYLTKDSKEFLDEVVEDKYSLSTGFGTKISPLKVDPIEPVTEWTSKMRRTGLIAKKIGVYPMWLKNGKRVNATLLQIVDNEVVKYIPPEKYYPVKSPKPRPIQIKNRLGCLIIGAENIDPQLLTKEYYSLFTEAGITPKRILRRFMITPEAALQPGTPLFAAHFKPGEVVDIRGKTIGRGFQGVMRRWGFKGMPATHGQTKTHRRPGNIGSGGTKARVMPGTKLPGHMGHRWRILRGVRILRINTKYNVIWVLGHNIPGEIGTYCYMYDTLLPLRRHKTTPNFPTYLPTIAEESLPEEMYADDVHRFGDPTIEFKEES